MERCSHLGINVFQAEGMEADDIIFLLLKRKIVSGYVTIVSSDKDFIQLIGGNITVFNPAKTKLISGHSVVQDIGYEPEEHLAYLILKGDKSDNIPGCKGMGDVRISQFLEVYYSIEEYLESGDDTWDKYPIRETYERNNPLINLKLFYLRFLRKTPTPLRFKANPQLSEFKAWLRKYEITRLNLKNFEKIL